MKLIKKKAVELSIELWEWLAETGEGKGYWVGWKRKGGSHEQVAFDCFLCELFNDDSERCPGCPYYDKYGRCTDGKRPFSKWTDARTVRTRKKYAGLFLEQLKEINNAK